MELTIIAVAAVVAIVAVAAVSQRIAVAAPLSMVIVGIALSFLPGLPEIEVNPEWILAGALPPLLYATAVHVPAQDFRRDFKAIAGLAVPLVVLTTLLAQGLTLPRVIRALKIPGDDAAADQAEYAGLLAELAAQAEEVLADPGLSRPGGRPYDSDVLDRVREAALARASLAEAAEPDTVSPREQYRHLMLRILAAERAELLAARSAGRYRSRTLSRAQRALDLMEATLQQIPDLADTES